MNANADEFTPTSRPRPQDAFAANLDRMMFEAETAARDPEMGLPGATSPLFRDEVLPGGDPSLSANEDDESHFKDNDGPSGWDAVEHLFQQKLDDMKKEFEAEMAAKGKKQVEAANMADLDDLIESKLMERVRDQFDMMEENIAKMIGTAVMFALDAKAERERSVIKPKAFSNPVQVMNGMEFRVTPVRCRS
jgi:hypothetical protein